QRDGQRRLDVAAMIATGTAEVAFLELGAAAPAARAAHAAECLLEQVLEAAEASAAGAAARAMETVGAPGEGLEIALAPEAAARPAETFKTLEARLALGVDLAAVERLALVRLAQDLVGGVELGEAIGGLGVVLVGVRMQLLGLLPERTLDLRRTRGLRHPQ